MRLTVLLPLLMGILVMASGAVAWYGFDAPGAAIFCALMGLGLFAVGVRRALARAVKAAKAAAAEQTLHTPEEVEQRREDIRQISNRLKKLQGDEPIDGCALPGFKPPPVPPRRRPSLLIAALLAAMVLGMLFADTDPLRERIALFSLERGAYGDVQVSPWSPAFLLARNLDTHREALVRALGDPDVKVAKGAARVLLAGDPWGEVVPDTLLKRFVDLNHGAQRSVVYDDGESYQMMMTAVGNFWGGLLLRRRGLPDLSGLRSSGSGQSYDDLDGALTGLLAQAADDLAAARAVLEDFRDGGRASSSVAASHVARLLLEDLAEGLQAHHALTSPFSNLPTLRPLFLHQRPAAVVGLKLLPGGRAVWATAAGEVGCDAITGTKPFAVRTERWPTGQELDTFDARVTSDERLEIVTAHDSQTLLWELRGDQLAQISSIPHVHPVSHLRFVGEAGLLLAAERAELVLLRVANGGLRPVDRETLDGRIEGVSSSSNRLLVGTSLARLYSGRLIRNRLRDMTPVVRDDAGIAAVLVHEAGDLIAVAYKTGVLYVHDGVSAQSLARGSSFRIDGHRAPIRALAVNETGDLLLSAGQDHATVLWARTEDLAWRPIGILETDSSVRCIALSADGGLVLVGCEDGTLGWYGTQHLLR